MSSEVDASEEGESQRSIVDGTCESAIKHSIRRRRWRSGRDQDVSGIFARSYSASFVEGRLCDGRFEQFDRITGRVVEKDLLPSDTNDNVIAKVSSRLA